MKKRRTDSFLSRFKIKNQLFLVFLLAVVIPSLLLGSFIFIQSVNILSSRAYEQLESDNLRARSVLYDTTLSFYTLSQDLLSDQALTDLLSNAYDSPEDARRAIDAYPRLSQILSNYPSLSSLQVYSLDENFPTQGFIQQVPEELSYLYGKVTVPGSFCWTVLDAATTQTGSPELALVRSFPLARSQHPAILVMRVSYNYLKNRIQNNKLFLSISCTDGPIFFCTQRSLQGTDETAPIDYGPRYFQSSGLLSYQGQYAFSHISSFIPYKSSDFVMYITSLDFDAPSYIFSFSLLALSLILLAIVLPLVMILFFSRSFSNRVNQLKDVIHSAALGDYDVWHSFRGDDELSAIFFDMQHVIGTIREKQAHLYESRLKEQAFINRQQEMEFKLLTSQINPHFMYNTLETIRMMALCDGAKDVARATAMLGRMMRYVLDNTSTTQVPLDKELSYIENYLSLQKLRFDDRVNYEITLPDGFDASRYQILPLLLQPLVENAVSHGLREKTGRGMIHIRLQVEEEQHLLICVEDNGVGMSPKRLDELTHAMEETSLSPHPSPISSSGIGLANIYQRIRLCYGPEFGMTLQSEEGSGTTIHMVLPLLPLS